ncbi:MAG: intradiol ring-cleavage dioxygenase [Sphingobium sp. SCN 64-10]|nr:MAG: intradiol ring-cleavage dioxygenase [Sphingobium sp. SCN 64-10]
MSHHQTATESAHTDDHDHDHGLAHDLATIRRLQIGRRRALLWLGSAGSTALLVGCGGESGSSTSTATTIATGTVTATPTPTPTPTTTATPTPSGTCTVPATETNGPYPADGTNTSSGATSNVLTYTGVVRQDIRSSFVGSSTTTATGIRLDITITLVDANNSCAPLAGYAVYIWHCDRSGNYSLYNLPAESYLRGVQVSDANGKLTFTTIFPGCYTGRYPHIHFEVFSSLSNAIGGRYARLISQFALPATQCAQVYATSDYSGSRTPYSSSSLSSDNVFGDNSTAQMAVMTLTMSGDTSAGFTASATIGIAT